MKERPILFSAPMVRAILHGRKTQTRRLVGDGNSIGNYKASELLLDHPDVFVDGGPSPAGNPGPYLHVPVNASEIERRRGWERGDCDDSIVERLYPRIQPGDQRWVRETWAPNPFFGAPDMPEFWYRADGEFEDDGPWRSPIHMPRRASRITLEVTDVRVQRVQEISREDAIEEGVFDAPDDEIQQAARVALREGRHQIGPCDYFRELWDSINAKRGHSWESNPWVWAITFRRVEP